MFFLRPGVIGGWLAACHRVACPARSGTFSRPALRTARLLPCTRRSADGGDDDSYRCAAVRLLAGATAGLPSREIPSSLPDPLETLGLGLVRTGKLRDSSSPLQIYPHVCKHCFPTYSLHPKKLPAVPFQSIPSPHYPSKTHERIENKISISRYSPNTSSLLIAIFPKNPANA